MSCTWKHSKRHWNIFSCLNFHPYNFLWCSLYFIGSKIHWVSEYWTTLSDNFIMFQYSDHEVLSNSWTLVWHSGHGLNNEPFNYQVTTDLLKTRLVCYSDHHCTKCLFFKSGAIALAVQSVCIFWIHGRGPGFKARLGMFFSE